MPPLLCQSTAAASSIFGPSTCCCIKAALTITSPADRGKRGHQQQPPSPPSTTSPRLAIRAPVSSCDSSGSDCLNVPDNPLSSRLHCENSAVTTHRSYSQQCDGRQRCCAGWLLHQSRAGGKGTAAPASSHSEHYASLVPRQTNCDGGHPVPFASFDLLLQQWQLAHP